MIEAVLRVEGLCRQFGEFAALSDASLAVAEGATHAVIGPNGAGKTTLINVITGVLAPTAGKVLLGTRDITGLSAYRIARHGLVRTFQITSLFNKLTVRENVEVALVARRKYHAHSGCHAGADEVLGLVGLEALAEQKVENISHGDQRLLEVALAIAAEPRVLLLDEPTAGMSPSETANFVELLVNKLKGRHTVVIVEHDMEVVMRTADRISVLQRGSVIADGAPAEVMRDAVVREAYLGRAHG